MSMEAPLSVNQIKPNQQQQQMPGKLWLTKRTMEEFSFFGKRAQMGAEADILSPMWMTLFSGKSCTVRF